MHVYKAHLAGFLATLAASCTSLWVYHTAALLGMAGLEEAGDFLASPTESKDKCVLAISEQVRNTTGVTRILLKCTKQKDRSIQALSYCLETKAGNLKKCPSI